MWILIFQNYFNIKKVAQTFVIMVFVKNDNKLFCKFSVLILQMKFQIDRWVQILIEIA